MTYACRIAELLSWANWPLAVKLLYQVGTWLMFCFLLTNDLIALVLFKTADSSEENPKPQHFLSGGVRKILKKQRS